MNMYQSLKPSPKGQLLVFLILSIFPLIGVAYNTIMHATLYITAPFFICSELMILCILKILERHWMLDKITEDIPKESYTKGREGFMVLRLVLLLAGVTGMIILGRGLLRFCVFCFLIISELIIEIIWQSKKNKQLRIKIVSIFSSKIC